MILSGAVEARKFGAQLAGTISSGRISEAVQAAKEYTNDKNPFRLLDLVGSALGKCPGEYLLKFMDGLADTHHEGAWVIIASALNKQTRMSLQFRMEKCAMMIRISDTWYSTDIFAERVPGPFLVDGFHRTAHLLENWRFDQNAWIRRATGVTAHFWAKRTKGSEPHLAKSLFQFLSPLLEERDIRAAKGIGWGLKTLGRYYPQIAHPWMVENLLIQKRKPLAVVRRKALTYLPPEMKADFNQ